MTTTVIWAGAAALAFMVLLWRIEVLVRYYFTKKFGRAFSNDEDERAAALLERRNAAELARLTLEAQAGLKNAQLARETALVAQGAEFDVELREDRLAAERAAIAALRDAKIALAEVFARNEHEDTRPPFDYEALVGRYQEYVVSMPTYTGIVDFPTFVEALNNYEGE